MFLMARETTAWERMITDIQEIKKMVNKMEDTGKEVITALTDDKHFFLCVI